METRRHFLQSLAALALSAAPLSNRADEEVKPDVNATLGRIVETLRASPVIESIDEHLVDQAEIGLVQWRWSHFRQELHESWYPEIEKVNGELFTVMKEVRAIEDAGLDALMLEGMIEGSEEKFIENLRQIHRELIRTQFTFSVPFTLTDIPPSEEKLRAELNKEENLREPVSQIIYPDGYSAENIRMTPLARLGVGYTLSTQEKVTLLAAEDPEIDRQATAAESSRSTYLYNKWVLRERDRHFIALAREYKRRIVHLIVGNAHNLTDDVAASNAVHDAQMSHIVISVQGIEGEMWTY